ncbi:MAG: hypothetical protein JW788_01235 [Candidatus Omnitrophica bacterium]|nr:hypothetical protein [Candidatus Omnitrophota bacterium]
MKSILLIEDEELICESLRRFLKIHDYRAVIARNAIFCGRSKKNLLRKS